MAPEGAFDETDVAMMVHPEPSMTAVGGKTLAIESLQTEFFGKASHAGNAPEKGINALDAAVKSNQAMSAVFEKHLQILGETEIKPKHSSMAQSELQPWH